MPFEELQNVSPAILGAIYFVGGLIILVAAVSVIVSIWLTLQYIVYNRRKNARNLTGNDAARHILDQNGLQHIKVSVVGSLMFGNSYSHYFKKVRLRRLTVRKPSIASLAMGAEKAALAVLDKENDPDMKKRVALTPLIYFGPLAFVPLLVVGVIVDFIFFGFSGVVSLIALVAAFLFYVLSFVLSIMVLKTEIKAQDRACRILQYENMATAEEIVMIKKLFKLYNIQYVNDIVLELLQLILRILQFVAKAQSNSENNA